MVNVAYSRVLFLGTAGVGKSSFKNSLMKLPWDLKANSTIISDVSCVRPFAKELLSEQWEAVTHEAEIEAMAHLFSAVSKDEKHHSVLIDPTDDVTTSPFSYTARMKLDSLLRQVSRFQFRQESRQLEPHFLMHFWDCGGQPAFLEILPVFLTSRTTFLLHFDASKDLNSKWKSVHHIDGTRYDGEEVNVSTLTYLLNWMACVHSHLMKYGADGSIPDYPCMFCIGTHGDLLTDEKKEQVRSELISRYKDKEYAKLVSDTLIIDNTSSGKGESEDPNIEIVRSAIIDITNKLMVKTPISWVFFRKVLQALEENIVSISLAQDVGAACKIPPEDVPLVLLFYHDLGSVLYYPQLKSLKDKVIVNPKFFIDALGKIFTFQASTTHVREWEIFHEYGILIQPLYASVWKECGDLKPEDFIEVLLHFCLAAQVTIEDQDICPSRYRQYFIPAILKLHQDNATIVPHSKEVASPLHIKFETGFVPPGFFTRFVAVIAAHPNTTLYLEKGVYRNRVTFRYQEGRNRSIEHLTVTDQHDAIQINVYRVTSRSNPVPLANVCQDILVLLEDSAKEVENILQSYIGRGFEELPKYSISRSLRYICDGCPVSSKLHYLTPAKYQTSDLEITCRVNITYRPLTEKEKIWFTEKVIIVIDLCIIALLCNSFAIFIHIIRRNSHKPLFPIWYQLLLKNLLVLCYFSSVNINIII